MPQAQSLQLAIVSSCRLIARLRDLRLTADAARPEPSWSNTDPWIKSRKGSRLWRFDCGRRRGIPILGLGSPELSGVGPQFGRSGRVVWGTPAADRPAT
jgi:hypothetical protein